VLLRDIEELPIEEVAVRLGIGVSAAKSRLLRARRELRERVLRHCGRTGYESLISPVTAEPGRLRSVA
jgi:RNA polymerase sigma-70 factor (ECF subfamily)